jgi:hypothetical protein
MIVFKTKEENKNTGSITSFIKNFGAMASEKLAQQLNNKEIKMKCNKHPGQNSIVLVDAGKSPIVFEIEDVCCEDFRKKLLLFLEDSK